MRLRVQVLVEADGDSEMVRDVFELAPRPLAPDTVGIGLAEAKELLAAAGYEPGEYEVSFVYDASTPEGEAAAEQRERGYKESGFAVKKYPFTGGSLYDVWTNPDHALYKKINLLGTAWCQDWPSPATFLPPIVETGAAYNTGNFSVPEIDEEITRIKNLPIEEQADAWGALNEKVMTEYFPIIPTAFRNDLYAFGEKIGNPSGDGSIGAPNYKDLYVTQ